MDRRSSTMIGSVTREGRKTGSKERGPGELAYPMSSLWRNAAAEEFFINIPKIRNLW